MLRLVTPFVFILGCLASYRLSVLVVRDAGPWGVFARLRKVTRLSKLLSCIFCVSVWVGAAVEAALYLSGIRDIPVVAGCIALSFSAVTIALDRVFSSDVVQN